MQLTIRGKNVEITESLRDYICKKFRKLEKLMNIGHPLSAQVNMAVERGRHIVEVTVPVNGVLLRGEEATGDWAASIDQVAEKLEKQWTRWKTRVIDRSRVPRGAVALEEPPVTATAEETGRLVKVKRFPVKPMTVDEAIGQMDLLGHDFFLFLDGDSNQVSVVYRRKDGNYGMLVAEA